MRDQRGGLDQSAIIPRAAAESLTRKIDAAHAQAKTDRYSLDGHQSTQSIFAGLFADAIADGAHLNKEPS